MVKAAARSWGSDVSRLHGGGGWGFLGEGGWPAGERRENTGMIPLKPGQGLGMVRA